MDRPVPGSEASERFGLVSPPHAGRDNARRASFGPNRVAEVISPIGTVDEHLAWIIGQGVGSGAPSVDVGRRDRDLLDQSRCRVGADVGFEAVHRALALMLDPAAIYIVFAGRSDDRRIDQRANLDHDRSGLELCGHRIEQRGIETMRDERPAVWIRRQSLSLPNMFSILCRWRERMRSCSTGSLRFDFDGMHAVMPRLARARRNQLAS